MQKRKYSGASQPVGRAQASGASRDSGVTQPAGSSTNISRSSSVTQPAASEAATNVSEQLIQDVLDKLMADVTEIVAQASERLWSYLPSHGQLFPPLETMLCHEVFHPFRGDKDRGAEFEFHESKTFPWNWRDLVASLRDEDIDLLCHGDLVDPAVRSGGPVSTDRSGGLISCRCGFDPYSSDIAMFNMEQTKA